MPDRVHPAIRLIFRTVQISVLLSFASIPAAPAGGGTPSTAAGSLTENGYIIETSGLNLRITDRLVILPALRGPDGLLSMVSPAAPGGAFRLQANGRTVDFRAELEQVLREEVADSFGRGVRFTVPASADLSNAQIKAAVSLTCYDNFPEAVVCSARFTNLGPGALKIERLESQCYRLDRRLLDPRESPWRFASYQGAAYRWGADYALINLDYGFEQENPLGPPGIRGAPGGGTPLADLWAPECGLAVACVEAEPQWITIPVKVGADGLAEVSISQELSEELGLRTVLGPGESCATVRTALILHHLDFFDPLRTYAGLLRAGGVAIPLSSPPETHEPYWKTWGFRDNFTLEMIYRTLPQLKSFGIHWANLDAGWFTYAGDWEPDTSRAKFGGEEKNLRAFTDHLHREGFKSSLWWYPQGADPKSKFAAEHPDWLVMNRDGSFPAGPWGMYYLCPAVPEVVGHVDSLAGKILGAWGFDGLYLDGGELVAVPPCFNPAHHHGSPLDSFRGQAGLFKVLYRTAQRLRPGCPIEMCICGIPHDPYKMPYYNVATTSDPVDLLQVRRRAKVEKAFRGTGFTVGDGYQVPQDEWDGWSVDESFESALAVGAQMTTLYADLTPAQEKTWKWGFEMYRRLRLDLGEYLNLYDLAFDKPETHVVRKDGRLYFGFFAPVWSRGRQLVLRGLDSGKTYRARDYLENLDLGEVSGARPYLNRAFKDHLLIELTPE